MTFRSTWVPQLLDRPEVARPVCVGQVRVAPLNAMLTDPFPIASDRATRVDCVDNVLVSITSRKGITGYGEAAPFFGISGDTQELIINDLEGLAPHLEGSALTVFELERIGREALGFPSARAALETAFFDILSKEQRVPLSRLLNGRSVFQTHETDVTIPLVDADTARKRTARYADQGFRRFKIKVGDRVEKAVERIQTVNEMFMHSTSGVKPRLLIDANEGYATDQLTLLLFQLFERSGIYPHIVEQPVKRHDIKSMLVSRSVAEIGGAMVFADESVYDVEDARRIIRSGSADGINLKLMKHGGIVEAMRIAELAGANGLKLMIGGMVETRLAMTASLHLASALGGVHWLDLDTPLFLNEEILAGGMIYCGPQLRLPDAPGIGVTLI